MSTEIKVLPLSVCLPFVLWRDFSSFVGNASSPVSKHFPTSSSTASTLSIKTCGSPRTKAALPPRDAKPRPAPRLPGSQAPRPQPRRLPCLHGGVNRTWKPARSPPEQSLLRSRGEHVFIDSSLTNINPPASCLLRNGVK